MEARGEEVVAKSWDFKLVAGWEFLLRQRDIPKWFIIEC
jgi:hypothetical protein